MKVRHRVHEESGLRWSAPAANRVLLLSLLALRPATYISPRQLPLAPVITPVITRSLQNSDCKAQDLCARNRY